MIGCAMEQQLKLFTTGSLEGLMDRALLLEEKNVAIRKAGLMNLEKKLLEKTMGGHTCNFTRWEREEEIRRKRAAR